jgi:zinc/manganese transport system permease protein
VASLAGLYAIIALLHWLARRLAGGVEQRRPPAEACSPSIWDFLFFLSFGIVVASSVSIAGVLLVFSFLIVPAVIGSIFSGDLRVVLAIAWCAGAPQHRSFRRLRPRLPTGAAWSRRSRFLACSPELPASCLSAGRRAHLLLRRALLALALMLTLASSVWLIVNPAADQPLAALFEGAIGTGPAHFLSAGDRDIYDSATRDMARFQREVDQLNAREKAARFQGEPLSDEEIRRIASYQQSFNEMARGERFVQEVLRGKARTRELWIIGVPAAIAALLGLGWLARPYWRRLRGGVAASDTSRSSIVA